MAHFHNCVQCGKVLPYFSGLEKRAEGCLLCAEVEAGDLDADMLACRACLEAAVPEVEKLCADIEATIHEFTERLALGLPRN